MEEGDIKKKPDNKDSDIVFSRTIKAGKRVYYLDVKKNRNEEMFLSITESKKVIPEGNEQNVRFEKHKIFLYKEDFNKFQYALKETLDFIKENNTVDFVSYPSEKDKDIDNGDIETVNEEIELKFDF
jgi:lipopolysaccharide export LptBFGC system permease protein LptF